MRYRYYLIALLFVGFTADAASAQSFFVANFSAAQQTQEVTSPATGTAVLALTDDGLRFILSVEGLSGDIAAAHFHNGAAGMNGPVVRTLLFEGNTAIGLWTSADAEPLTDELRDALLKGELYLNVHTAANPGGEIRGQVNPKGVVVTAIEVEEGKIPEAFSMAQNYPNPFNPSTTIAFALAHTTPVTIAVYNVLGQRVATLVDATLAGGRYQVTFDAGSLPSGVYQYRLEAGGELQSRSMLLIK